MIHLNKPHAPSCPPLWIGLWIGLWLALADLHLRPVAGEGKESPRARKLQVASAMGWAGPALQGEQEPSQLGAVLCASLPLGEGERGPTMLPSSPCPVWDVLGQWTVLA